LAFVVLAVLLCSGVVGWAFIVLAFMLVSSWW
jgi:hypothetical protein